MPEDNVEAYRGAVAAWNAGEVDELLAFMADDVELDSFLVAFEGRFHGHDGVRRWWQSFQDTLPDWQAEIEEIQSHGEATIARIHVSGHGRESGAPIDQVIWHVVAWRGGKIVRFSPHRSAADALEAIDAAG